MSEPSLTQFLRIERTEAALRISEATRIAILNAALDCIVTIDHEGTVLDWNPAAERTFGYTAAEAIGREMADLIIPAPILEMHRRGLARAVSTGNDVLAGKRIEITARRKNGEEFPVELAITRIVAGPNPLFTGHIRDISDRKQAERTLRESQQLLTSITHNITEAIFRRSQQDGLVFVNDAYLKMFGFDSAEEVRRVPPQQFYADPSRRARILKSLERDGGIRDEEIEYRRRDGTTFWGLTSATGIRDEATGNLLYFDGAIHDITSRKQAEQLQAAQYTVTRMLADSTTLEEAAPKILRTVSESLRWDMGTLWRVDAAKQVLRCVDLWHKKEVRANAFITSSRRAEFKLGVGLPGRIWRDNAPHWIPDVTRDENFPRAQIAAETGFHGAFGFPIRLGNEVLGVIEFFSREIRQPDAEILEMFSAIGSQIGQFIQRREAEENLRQLNLGLEQRVAERTAALLESETRFKTVTEHTPAAIVVLDTDTGRFIEANENAIRLFGFPREELLKVGPAELSPAFQPEGRRSAKSAREKIQKALAGGAPVFEWTHRTASGRSIPCEVRVARMPAAGRNLVVGAITDITARKQAEAELLAALEQEKELSQLKTNFVNLVSHEFRTPLGVILSAADILASYFDRLKAEQRAGHLQDIRHATQQMTSLMEEVLLLGRVESGKMVCKPEAMDLVSFCQRLVEEQLSATNHKCPIVFKAKELEGPAIGDEGLLRHILANLLSNAVKYSPPNTVVHFSAERHGDDVRFEIRDRGIGIPAADQPRLYEAFHRGLNVGEIPGTGLGMVIVKRCADLHGAKIELSSEVGRGTTFVIHLKLFRGDSESAARPTMTRTVARTKPKRLARKM